jgi:hypothetical protein
MNRVILASPSFHGRAAGSGRRGGGFGRPIAPATAPALGAHASAAVAVGDTNNPLTTGAITTQAGLMLACVARGNILNFSGLSGATPQDNKGNPAYTQVGSTEAYAPPFDVSGTALYKLVGGSGGSGYQVSVAQGQQADLNKDEVDLFLIEILNGSVVQDFTWNEVTSAGPTTTGNVTTTGPALLVSFWFGESSSLTTSATPDSGFSLLEFQALSSSAIQGAMAAKQVSSPGTYNVTWTAAPTQGAQMWIVAVQ